MKKLVGLFISVFMLISAFSGMAEFVTTEQLVKAPAFKWGMSKEEVEELLGCEGTILGNTELVIRETEEGPEVVEELLGTEREVLGTFEFELIMDQVGLEAVGYPQLQRISKYDANMFLFFLSDQLAGRMYWLGGYEADSAYEYLGKALDQLYGRSSDDGMLFPELFDHLLFGDENDPAILDKYSALKEDLGAKYRTWMIDSETSVTMLYVYWDGAPYASVILFYGHPSAHAIYDLSGL